MKRSAIAALDITLAAGAEQAATAIAMTVSAHIVRKVESLALRALDRFTSATQDIQYAKLSNTLLPEQQKGPLR